MAGRDGSKADDICRASPSPHGGIFSGWRAARTTDRYRQRDAARRQHHHRPEAIQAGTVGQFRTRLHGRQSEACRRGGLGRCFGPTQSQSRESRDANDLALRSGGASSKQPSWRPDGRASLTDGAEDACRMRARRGKGRDANVAPGFAGYALAPPSRCGCGERSSKLQIPKGERRCASRMS